MSRGAHNPEVAGSNPAPATNASAISPQVNGSQAQLAGRFRVWGGVRSDQIADKFVSGVPPCLRSAEAFETIEHDRDGPSAVRRRSPGRFPGGRIWSGVGLSRTFEDGVVTDSAPPTAEVAVDGDELEGGAVVGAGE